MSTNYTDAELIARLDPVARVLDTHVLDNDAEAVRESARRLRAYAARLAEVEAMAEITDEQCDRAAAQAMDRIAAARGMHALDLNHDITSHHSLRRELVRAGAALTLNPPAPAGREGG